MSEENEDEGPVTDAMLRKLLPPGFKLNKSLGSRADLLKQVDELASVENKKIAALEKFVSKLKQWFIENLPAEDSTGVSGKIGKVAITRSDVATVNDWSKFQAYIIKNKAFELMNKAVNQKAIRERWEQGKQIPGVEKFQRKKVSLTAVKKD